MIFPLKEAANNDPSEGEEEGEELTEPRAEQPERARNMILDCLFGDLHSVGDLAVAKPFLPKAVDQPAFLGHFGDKALEPRFEFGITEAFFRAAVPGFAPVGGLAEPRLAPGLARLPREDAVSGSDNKKVFQVIPDIEVLPALPEVEKDILHDLFSNGEVAGETAADIEKAIPVAVIERGKSGLIAGFQQVKKLFVRIRIVTRHQSRAI